MCPTSGKPSFPLASPRKRRGYLCREQQSCFEPRNPHQSRCIRQCLIHPTSFLSTSSARDAGGERLVSLLLKEHPSKLHLPLGQGQRPAVAAGMAVSGQDNYSPRARGKREHQPEEADLKTGHPKGMPGPTTLNKEQRRLNSYCVSFLPSPGVYQAPALGCHLSLLQGQGTA